MVAAAAAAAAETPRGAGAGASNLCRSVSRHTQLSGAAAKPTAAWRRHCASLVVGFFKLCGRKYMVHRSAKQQTVFEIQK